MSSSLLNSNGNEISFQTNSNCRIEIIFLSDPNLNIPSGIFQNTSTSAGHNYYFLFSIH